MNINMQILSIAKIDAEATKAAKTHTNVNDCCPYPFDTAAGRVYRLAFEAALKEAEDPINVGAALDIKADLQRFSPATHSTSIAHIARVNATLQRTNPV